MSEEPTVTVESQLDEETGRPVYCYIWEFPAEIAPKTRDEGDDPSLVVIKGEATWKPRYTPFYLDSKHKKQTLDGAISTWAAPVADGSDPSAARLVEGANLYLDRKFYNGTLEVTITWTAHASGSTESHTHTQTVGNALNSEATETVKTEVPRLSTALLADLTSAESSVTVTEEAEPDDDAAAHAYFGGLIEAAIGNLHQRLRAGMGRYWRGMGRQCTNGAGDMALSEIRDDDALSELSMQQLDETWAQLVSELFVGTCYHGPGSHMGLSAWPGAPGAHIHKKDSRWFHYVRARAQGNEIPEDDAQAPTADAGAEYVVSLCHACQQLDTALLMSRNADFYTLAEDPLDCHYPNQHGKIDGKFWHIGNVGAVSGAQLAENGWLVPGACYFMDASRNHIGLVLRAFQSTLVQMLDTDGWGFNPNPFPIPPKSTTTHTQINSDTQAVSQLPRELHSVLIPPQTSQANLIAAIRLLHSARPLGVVRLVVFRRGQRQDRDNILYVSPKLFMHEGDGSDYRYYSIAALLGSLRACPHADKLDVRWQIYRPLRDAAVRNACNIGRTSRWWDGTAAENQHSPTMELATDSSGKPFVLARNSQGFVGSISFDAFLNQLESVGTSAEIAAQRSRFKRLADVTNSNLPAYFQK